MKPFAPWDAKATLAVLVSILSFGVLILYIVLNRTPDGYAIAIVSAAISGVVNAYFGHANGVSAGLAMAATTLANQVSAAQRVQQGVDSVGIPTKPAS